MALIKVLKTGDELLFDLSNKIETARIISVMVVEKAGRSTVLKITADRSIEIKHSKQIQLGGR
jgi:hypothetical protein